MRGARGGESVPHCSVEDSACFVAVSRAWVGVTESRLGPELYQERHRRFTSGLFVSGGQLDSSSGHTPLPDHHRLRSGSHDTVSRLHELPFWNVCLRRRHQGQVVGGQEETNQGVMGGDLEGITLLPDPHAPLQQPLATTERNTSQQPPRSPSPPSPLATMYYQT